MQLNPLDPRFAQIPTPALVLDAVALDANIARMAALAKACNISLRPHAKAHKSLVIARRQCAAGAIGLACATLAEAEHLIDRQVPHILLTSPLAGEEKCARFVALSRRGPIASVVDDMSEALRLSALSDGLSLDLAIDVDVGQARTGVIDPGHAVTLAKQITALPNLRFVGVQGYAGHAQHLATFEERKKAARRSAGRLREVVTALTEAGLRPGFVSGGGTGTANIDMREGPYTDLQVGSYLLMDAEYRDIRDENSERLPFLQSLYILATVVSTCRAGEITVDAGTKALAVNGPMPDHLLGIPAGASYRFWGDEHGTIILPPGTKPPRTGARILIPATHCDPTVNLYPVYHVVTNEGPLSIWPIVGRYGWVSSKGESFRFDFDMDRD